VVDEAKLLLVGIPVLLWTLVPIYHMFLFAISERDSATSGRLWPKNPTLQNFEIVFQQKHFYLDHFWVQLGNSVLIALAVAVITLVIATSAAFAQDLDWTKLDVVTFSWQKALGGEGAHGVLILGPRAVARLESYSPPWPMPKLFRMTKGGKVNLEIFEGATINTPSMLCVEDCLDALGWASRIGGLAEMQRRADANLAVLDAWVAKTPWVAFLAEDAASRSNTSVCLKVIDPRVSELPDDAQADFAKKLASLLELKYRAVSDATVQLGVGPGQIREAFVGFQRRLFVEGP
jgi:phosphoserine aminotransferase